MLCEVEPPGPGTRLATHIYLGFVPPCLPYPLHSSPELRLLDVCTSLLTLKVTPLKIKITLRTITPALEQVHRLRGSRSPPLTAKRLQLGPFTTGPYMAHMVRMKIMLCELTADHPAAPIDVAHSASQDVRDDTAQLASWASKDLTFQTRSTAHQHNQAPPRIHRSNSDLSGGYSDQDPVSRQRSNSTQVPDMIEEVVEPPSPDTTDSSSKCSPSSLLSERLRNSTTTKQDDKVSEDDASFDGKGLQPAIVGQGIISQPDERTALLLKKTACRSDDFRGFGSSKDLESQKATRASPVVNYQRCIAQVRESSARFGRSITSPKSWDMRDLWVSGIRQPANYIPPVILGLLLNILDALSYGA